MEVYKLSEDIKLIGFQVTTFPLGIEEAFRTLMEALGGEQAFYGVSWMNDNDEVQYYVMANEASSYQGGNHSFETLIIEKGEYDTEVLNDWRSKTDRIKDIFNSLIGQSKSDKNRPCVEWYQTNDKMLCMIKSL